MSDRVVVYSSGDNPDPIAGIVERLRSHGVAIIEKQPTMLLVAGEPTAIDDALSGVSGWAATEEKIVPRPRTRVKARRPP
jgi:hypothetical protein